MTVSRSAKKVVQVERLQRRGKRQHDLQNEPDGDQLAETARHDVGVEGQQYKLSTGRDARVAMSESRKSFGDSEDFTEPCVLGSGEALRHSCRSALRVATKMVEVPFHEIYAIARGAFNGHTNV